MAFCLSLKVLEVELYCRVHYHTRLARVDEVFGGLRGRKADRSPYRLPLFLGFCRELVRSVKMEKLLH